MWDGYWVPRVSLNKKKTNIIMVILRSSVALFSKRTPFLCNIIEVEKPRKNFKCKTNSCRMPKYKLYRLYFHFITFQITTNALVLAQPSNSDQTLRQ